MSNFQQKKRYVTLEWPNVKIVKLYNISLAMKHINQYAAIKNCRKLLGIREFD